jgi:hypothetical protein
MVGADGIPGADGDERIEVASIRALASGQS